MPMMLIVLITRLTRALLWSLEDIEEAKFRTSLLRAVIRQPAHQWCARLREFEDRLVTLAQRRRSRTLNSHVLLWFGPFICYWSSRFALKKADLLSPSG